MKSPQLIHSLAAQLAGLGLLNAAAAVADRPGSAAVDTTAGHMARWLQHPQRVARVIRADVPPVVDGVLDDEAWFGAPAHTGFIQRDPDQGKPATERTEFRVVYDDEALYIAGICYDSRPDRITPRLARRDEWRERDLFEVSLDPHHDHQTGAFWRTTATSSGGPCAGSTGPAVPCSSCGSRTGTATSTTFAIPT